MDYYINRKTNLFISAIGVSALVSAAAFKARDSVALDVWICDAATPVDLAEGFSMVFAVKQTVAAAAPLLASAEVWTKIATGHYRSTLSLNTVPLNAALGDLGSMAAVGELTWSEDGGVTWQSTNTLKVTINNDVYKGVEGTPLASPTAEAWLDERRPVPLRLTAPPEDTDTTLHFTGLVGLPSPSPWLRVADFEGNPRWAGSVAGDFVQRDATGIWSVLSGGGPAFLSDDDVEFPWLVTTWNVETGGVTPPVFSIGTLVPGVKAFIRLDFGGASVDTGGGFNLGFTSDYVANQLLTVVLFEGMSDEDITAVFAAALAANPAIAAEFDVTYDTTTIIVESLVERFDGTLAAPLSFGSGIWDTVPTGVFGTEAGVAASMTGLGTSGAEGQLAVVKTTNDSGAFVDVWTCSKAAGDATVFTWSPPGNIYRDRDTGVLYRVFYKSGVADTELAYPS